jgi:hypothetical protein
MRIQKEKQNINSLYQKVGQQQDDKDRSVTQTMEDQSVNELNAMIAKDIRYEGDIISPKTARNKTKPLTNDPEYANKRYMENVVSRKEMDFMNNLYT